MQQHDIGGVTWLISRGPNEFRNQKERHLVEDGFYLTIYKWHFMVWGFLKQIAFYGHLILLSETYALICLVKGINIYVTTF